MREPLLYVLFLVLFIGGCSVVSLQGIRDSLDIAAANVENTGVERTRTIADLQPAADVAAYSDREINVSIKEVVQYYQDLLQETDNPELRAKIEYRLADLKMLQADNFPIEDSSTAESIAGDSGFEEQQVLLEQTIENYRALLVNYPKRKENHFILYQLARSYDLQGQQQKALVTLNRLVNEFPNSPFIPEAQFRRGDILYSNQRYQEAKLAFKNVIAQSEAGSAFYDKALYMQGWSQFKLGKFGDSLDTFVTLLDLSLADNQERSIKQVRANANIQSQTISTLVEDQFRVIGFALSYLDGVESLKALFEKHGPRDYEVQVYESYAQLLVSQELSVDALAVYQQFFELQPKNRWAPHLHNKHIELLGTLGRFDEQRVSKAKYISSYGIDSPYWKRHGNDFQQQVEKQLAVFIPELAQYHHATAQRSNEERPKIKSYQLAAGFYKSYIQTFPERAETVAMVYLLGESLGAANLPLEAIAAFERAAYEYDADSLINNADVLEPLVGEIELQPEAGYAAILAYQEVLKAVTTEEEKRRVLEQQLTSQLRFTNKFPHDARALKVLVRSMQTVFDWQDYPQSINLADQLLNWQPSPDSKLLTDVLLIKGHSYYAVEDFAQAEQAYSLALTHLAKSDPRTANTENLLAASVYKQAEELLAQNQTEAGIDELLRVGLLAPNADVAVSAQFDAATQMLAIGQFSRAIPVLLAFRNSNPAHPLSQDIPAKLALAYQETAQWIPAADELVRLHDQHPDVEVRRNSLYQAAEWYDQEQAWEQAIVTYRKYAHTYPLPMEEAMEARFKLTALYSTTNQPAKREFWQKKIIAAYDGQKEISSRVRYLVAQAGTDLAEKKYQEFQRIRLVAPLKKNLSRKKTAMEASMQAYKKAASLNVADFTTLATFKMGEIYRQFSTDLLDSERPKNLSALELEQYELLLEEQAYPFEENAIAIHESNAKRSWQGHWDEWIESSFRALQKLHPVRYARREEVPVASIQIH